MLEGEKEHALNKLPQRYKDSVHLSIAEFELDKLVAVEPNLEPLIFVREKGEWENLEIAEVRFDYLQEKFVSK